MAAPVPTALRLSRPTAELAVDWSDGLSCRYPLAFLRARCPSAGEKLARETPPTNPLAVLGKVPSHEVAALRAVGNYAIAFTWGDGHDAGIYTWEYLRELAESPQVVRTNPGDSAPPA